MTEISVTDTEFEETTVTEVRPDETGWEIKRADGWSFWVPKEYGVEPHVGDVARFYGRGIGYSVRGLTINGVVAYYRTEDEERAKFDRELAESHAEEQRRFEVARVNHDRRIAALPDVFRRRITRFQQAREDWRWRFERYELMCCEQAILFADTLKTVDAIEAFHNADWDEQKRIVPDLEEGHSGNSFDFACRLANSYLTDPELVYLDHGALAILVGCEEYGCPPVAQEPTQ